MAINPIYRYGPAGWDRSHAPGKVSNHARTYQVLSRSGGEVVSFPQAMRSYGTRGDSLNIDSCLLDRPGFVNLPVEFDGGSALHVAARRGHVGAVQNLVHRGAQVDVGDHARQTALHAASETNQCNVVLNLLAAGADSERRDEVGQTALHRAAHTGSIDTVLALLDYGADIRSRDAGGQMAVHKAALMGRAEALGIILSRDPTCVNEIAESGWTPLHLAAHAGHAAACEVLVMRGADLAVLDDERRTPLHRAASSGIDTVCQVLLRAAADPRAVDRRRCTPLHIACEDGFAQVARALLDAGAPADAADVMRKTPWRLAAEVGSHDTCEALVQYGADPAAGDPTKNVFSLAPASPIKSAAEKRTRAKG